MCEGGEPRPPRRRRRRHATPATAAATTTTTPAIDVAPPVLPHRVLHSITPEHVATLQIAATEHWPPETLVPTQGPVIVAQQYVVLPQSHGPLVVWKADTILSTSTATPLAPDYIIPAPQAAPIVGIAMLSPLQVRKLVPSFSFETGTPQSSSDWMLVATDIGDVSVVQLLSSEGNMEQLFQTGRCGVTALTITKQGVIVIGYESGFVEGYNYSDSTAYLLFRTSLERGNPIRALSQLCDPQPQPSLEGSCDSDTPSIKEYVILTVQTERHESTASMVEVMDLASVQNSWSYFEEKTSSHSAVPLEEHRILFEAGMELLDAVKLRSENHCFVNSAGTNGILSLVDGSRSCVLALADGTVGVVSTKQPENAARLSFGIASETDQLLLTHPCIGLGVIPPPSTATNLPTGSQNGGYIACCLRGSTTYLLPMGDTDARSQSEIKVLMYPQDVDSDSPYLRQVQGFTAGRLLSGSNGVQATSVVLYAWPGGLVDVLSISLLPKAPCPTQLLRELLENGSVQSLQDLLTGSDADDLPPHWTRAKAELLSLSLAEGQSLTLSDLCVEKCLLIRSVLLELAAVSSSAKAARLH